MNRNRPRLAAVAIIVVVMLGGCVSLFTAHFDTTRLNNLTTLKAMHLKFIDTWSVGSGNSWNRQQVSASCDQGDSSFRAAHEYAKSTDLKDGTAAKAVKLVWTQFAADCSASLEDQQLFATDYASEVRARIEGNYDRAIAGEKSRIGYDN